MPNRGLPKKPKEFIFMDLDGNVIHRDPRKQIKQANHLAKTIDYRAIHTITDTGLVELWGLRDRQEDRVVVGEINDFDKLTDEQRKYIMEATIQKLQSAITDKHIRGGSTLCLVMLYKQTIYTASVGDSNAFVAVLNAKGHIKTFFRLNRTLHHPDEPSETMRLAPENVHFGRLGGMLALSRAIGDNAFERFGLLHEPSEIYVDHLDIPHGGQAIVINACDGLTEADCLTEKDIQRIIKENQKESIDVLALKLAVGAYESGSEDNISVLVTRVTPQSDKTKFLAVFDGHCGDAVSEYLFQNFEKVLNHAIKLMEK